MEVRKQGRIMQVAVAGIVVAAIILIEGAFGVGKSASEDTEKAVRNMSLLYLNELADAANRWLLPDWLTISVTWMSLLDLSENLLLWVDKNVKRSK